MFIFILIISSVTQSQIDSCYNEISQNLKTNDFLKIAQSNGQTFSGYLKNLNKDSLTIKFKTDRTYQSPVLYNISLNKIDSIYFTGINRSHDFLKAKNTIIMGGLIGFFGAVISHHDVFRNYDNHTGTIVGYTVGGAVIGGLLGLLYESTNKVPPIHIVIRCNN